MQELSQSVLDNPGGDRWRLTPLVLPIVSFRDLYPGCAAGRGRVTERLALCDECCAEQTRCLAIAGRPAARAA